MTGVLKAPFPSLWSQYDDPLAMHPLRAELLSIDQLEAHGQSLADILVHVSKRRGRPLPRMFARTAESLRRSHAIIAAAYRSGEPLGSDAEWLLDNYHVISDAIQEIRTDLPSGYYRQLPKLADGPMAGYPRVYVLALELIAHCDSGLDETGITRFVQAFQTEAPLTVGELWAVPIMLRLCLIENLRRLAEQIVHSRLHRQRAHASVANCVARHAETLTGDGFECANVPVEWRDCYHVHLMECLHDHAAALPDGIDHLEQSLAAARNSSADVLRREKERQAANQVSIGNCVTSLRLLSALDWARFFENTSRLESMLREDPAGVYAKQDFATRDRYRRVIESLALGANQDELTVAKRALDMARQGVASGQDPRRGHVGYYLIDDGLALLEAALSFRAPLLQLPRRALLAFPNLAYFGGMTTIALSLVSALMWVGVAMAASPWLIGVLVAAAFIPFVGLAHELTNRVVMGILPPRTLPSLASKDGVPADCATFVVMPTLLASPAGATSLVERLEIHYLANSEANLFFALLTDFTDAPNAHMPEDEALLEAARQGIQRLNRKYCRGMAPRFFLLHRHRQWNPFSACWMGWERKRGKLAEFNRLLRGAGDTSFSTISDGFDQLPRIRFVITLDADTQLPRETARRLIAILAHPLNQAQFDEQKKRVVRGYSVLQPRVGLTMRGARRSWFARLFSGSAGIDPYTTAVSDAYQDLFGSGSYIGKGIYDVDSFEAAAGNTFPANHILSHDLIEGNYARCGLVTNVELLDDFPAHYLAYLRREHRWARGDWQILPWILGRVPGADGMRTVNPLPLLERWKVFDNLRRSLAPIALLAMLTLGWTVLPGPAWIWTTITSLLLFSALILQLFGVITRSAKGLAPGRWVLIPLRDLGCSAGQVGFSAILLVAHAANATDAVLRTLARLWITKRNLLEWETAASAEKRLGLNVGSFLRSLCLSPLVAIGLGIVIAFARPDAIGSASPYLLAWFLAPLIAFVLSRPQQSHRATLASWQESELRLLARKTWGFFETFVSQEDHWLPPDNYQEDPKNEVAHRTSPTNIGMYLLSCVTAHDLGYITLAALIDRLEKTMATLKTMERSHGHFFNWYDTRTLHPLHPMYLSSVDSGNLIACLLTLKQALAEKVAAAIVGDSSAHGFLDDVELVRDAMPKRAQGVAPRADDGWQKIEAGVLSLRVHLERPPIDLADWAERLRHAAAELVNIARQVENLTARMDTPPIIFQRRLTALTAAINARQEELAGLQQMAQPSEPVHQISLARHASAAAPPVGNNGKPATWATELLRRVRRVMGQAEEFAAAMDFTVLYNSDRHLFAVGYNQSLGRLDSSHYDLLASEANLTSFLAIARGEAPREHWFHLGRPLTAAGAHRVLVSWGGTMFEYLMPRLLLPIDAETLLGESQAGAVAAQIDYGRQCGAPWGISESAYFAVDAQLNYQYQAFGTPALGLKRGLGKDLVVAPYATGLAFMIDPLQAFANLRRLREVGAEGEFGWYEAIDFTAERLPQGRPSAVVKCYMAHHHGMTLVALGNCLLNDPMPRRFRAEPMVRATELLLQERVPADVPVSAPQPDHAELTTFHEIPAQLSRRMTTPHTMHPRTHLLASAHYSVMITAAGSGFSTSRGLAINRWREDAADDRFGHFFYLRDLSTRKTWSAGHQPTGIEADEYEAIFHADKVEFRRLDGKLETRMEVIVSPEQHAEVRRLTISNHDELAHEVELTSYLELVLLPQAADLAHPVFGKLFLETEFVRGANALLCRRRPRAPEQKPLWCVYVMAVDGLLDAPLEYETDRGRFLGRGRTPADPAALDSDSPPLSATVGAVLDPIFSLRRRFRLDPGASVHVAFTTALAESRAEAVALAESCKDFPSVHRAFELAWAHTQVELRQQHWPAAETHLFQRLSGHVIFAAKALRAPGSLVANNRRGQTDLWHLGLSGDLPIVLLRIAAEDELPLAAQVVAAHAFWRLKGFATDLVILNEEAGSYFELLHQRLQLLVRASEERGNLEKPAGVFLRKSDQLGPNDLQLLQSVARCVLVGSRGLLGVQLDRLEATRRPQESPARPAPSRHAENAAANTIAAEAPELAFENGLGGFRADGKEYVLRLQVANGRHVLPPKPWVNVVANASFGFLVSESGGGFTWAMNSQMNRLTPWHNDPVCDPTVEAIYLRDEQSGEFWSATPSPCGPAVEYTVRHGQGYSIFEHDYADVRCQLALFVSVNEPIKYFRLSVRNQGTRPRRLAAIFFAELVLGTHRDGSAAHIVTEIDKETGAILVRSAWHADFRDTIVFADVNQRPRTVTADRLEFLGRNGRAAAPAGCMRASLSGAVGACLDPCAALHAPFTLGPGEQKDIVFVFGEAMDIAEARRLVRKAHDPTQIRDDRQEFGAFWDRITGHVTIRTPNRALDLLVNRWLPYQVLSCRLWGRSGFYQSGGAYGFRDQLQDCMAFVYALPDEARRHLLRAAGRQFTLGDVQHWWHEPSGAGVRTRFSDDFLWLPFAVHHYVETTGDLGVLDEQVPFLEAPELREDQEEDYRVPAQSDETASLWDHCLRAIHHGLRLGVHGLPLMGTGDWNDGMNRVGAGGRGESVWLAWFLVAVLERFAALCDRRGLISESEHLREQARSLISSIELHAWDGQWYRRAYFDDGQPLGSAANEECRIDSLPQSWAVLSGGSHADRARTAMASVDEHLVKRADKLVLLFAPPFDEGELQPGYVKGYVPGIRENGGQYTHAAVWVAQAWALLGDADRAMEILNMINPILRTDRPETIEQYQLEPYVIAADIYSQPPHVGRGGWSWYTGSASWYYRVVIETIFGLDLRGDRLRLHPRLPRDWPEAKLTLHFRSSVYVIAVRTNGQQFSTLDGHAWDGVDFPLKDDGHTHSIVVSISTGA